MTQHNRHSFSFFLQTFPLDVPLKSQSYNVSNREQEAVKCAFEPYTSKRLSQGIYDWGTQHLQISVVSLRLCSVSDT